MACARYELRVAGWLSDRASRAFGAQHVAPVGPQTSICAELADRSELRDLLDMCSGMGLRLVSVRRLPGGPAEEPSPPGETTAAPSRDGTRAVQPRGGSPLITPDG